VILLELPVEQAQRRRRGEDDRIEAKGAAFQERVAEGYRRYAQLRPLGQEVAVVDARGTVEDVHARVWEQVQRAG
jgi:dTMP kinase